MRSTPHSRLLRRALGPALAIALLAGLPIAAQPAAAETLAEAEARVTDAMRAADAATGKYIEAENKATVLEDEVAAAERELERLRTERDELVTLAQMRAVIAYQGGTQAVGDLLDGSDVMESARRATLLDRVNDSGNQAIEKLQKVTDEVKDKERALQREAESQKKVMADLRANEQRSAAALTEAQQSLDGLKKKLEEEKRAAEYQQFLERARAAARANPAPSGGGAGRSGGGGGAGDSGGAGGGGGGRTVSGDWVCPVQGAVSFSNDWGDPRSGGRSHKGTDMFAARGTPVVAPVSGSVFFQSDSLGGLSAYVTGGGNTYYMTHLDGYVGGARNVSAGEQVGINGSSGNAPENAPHVHFEIRVGGPNGERINPYPTLAAHC